MGPRRQENMSLELARRRLGNLPKPDKAGKSEDGWESSIWTRGVRAFRFRMREGEFEVLEFCNTPEGLKEGRLAVGGLEFCLKALTKWLSPTTVRAGSGSSPARGSPASS